MNASPHPALFSSASSTATAVRLLARQLDEAQRLERGLWSAQAEGGTNKLTDATAADVAWVRVRSTAEHLVAQAPVGWQGGEKRLAAAFLLSVLDAVEPEQVDRLQATARTLSSDGQVRASGSVAHLLHLIGRGPFVVSGLGHPEVAPAEDERALVLSQ